MEKTNEERMTNHKAELKRARANDGGGSSGVGYQGVDSGSVGYQGGGNYNGGGKREYKKPRNENAEERKARNRAKLEKRIEDKLNKPASGGAHKREWHGPDMIKWGGHCWTHG